MFKWLDKRMSKKMADEMEHFLVSLKGSDQIALDLIAATTFMWAAFFKARGKDMFIAGAWLPQDKFFPLQLQNMLRDQQKAGNTSSATGLMVWLHSCRALLYPELRLSGREIWSELSKAGEEAHSAYFELIVVGDIPDIDQTIGDDVPIGLEQLNR